LTAEKNRSLTRKEGKDGDKKETRKREKGREENLLTPWSRVFLEKLAGR
jgi:hypothetical protein